MSFGLRLKEKRESMGITQVQLAAMLGITKGAIGNYETDLSSPRASILYRVFDVLKCDANYLFQDEMNTADTNIMSLTELQVVKKYRALDEHGKEIIDFVLGKEYERCDKETA